MDTINFMFRMETPSKRQSEILAEIDARSDVSNAGRLVDGAKETSVTYTMCWAVANKGADTAKLVADLKAYAEIESVDVAAERHLITPAPKHNHGPGHCDCGDKH
jgi:hypothetical protein